MFDLDGQGGAIAINGRPAGTLKRWWYGPTTQRQMRLRAEVVLLPIYRRLGASGTAQATLEPRTDATRPARITVTGPITEYKDGMLVMMPVTQTAAEAIDVRKS